LAKIKILDSDWPKPKSLILGSSTTVNSNLEIIPYVQEGHQCELKCKNDFEWSGKAIECKCKKRNCNFGKIKGKCQKPPSSNCILPEIKGVAAFQEQF